MSFKKSEVGCVFSNCDEVILFYSTYVEIRMLQANAALIHGELNPSA